MRNWRVIAGALCIVAAMVLGAFAGIVFAMPGIVGVSPNPGTRGEDRRVVSAFDETQRLYTEDEILGAEGEQDRGGATTLSATTENEVVGADGTTAARLITPEDTRFAREEARTFASDEGVISVKTEKPSSGTRGHLVGGEIDAGGPYGGPDVLEGVDITFSVTILDPNAGIIFFRWDFNADGIYDWPDQTGKGTLGAWTTDTSKTQTFNDNYFGNVVVQGWDGVSTTVEINTGDNLGEPTSPYWYVFPGSSGHKFTPKSDLQITELGAYQWFNQAPYGYNLRIWQVSPPTFLGGCKPSSPTFQWAWCTLANPITVLTGQEYIIAEHKTVDYFPYWMGILGPPSEQPAKVTIGNFFYCWIFACGSNAFPATDGGGSVTMMTDFRWTETLILPDAASDAAFLEIKNVAPNVFDVVTSPNPGLEGNPTQFLASFNDPGLDDTWEYRWLFHDGEITPWRSVSKFNGGAKVLIFHTYAGDATTLRNQVASKCGHFCVTIDLLDFGPTGENRVPPLSEIIGYDVLVVGTNYFFGHSDGIGDLLADYMDAAADVGGGVVMMQGGLDNAFGCGAGICGRWDEEMYSPIPRGFIYGPTGSMGTIYEPGHPLLDGVSSVSTNGLAGTIFDVNPGATRVVDWNDGRVLGGVRTNPMVDNGARSVALNFFPILGFTGGDFAQMIANAVRWASRQPDPVLKVMPIQLDPAEKIYKDDHPFTTTPQDLFTMIVQVRDDDHDKLEIQSETPLLFEDFEEPGECFGYWPGPSTFPAGWVADPSEYSWECEYDGTMGSQHPMIWYYYNDPLYGTGDGNSYLYMPSVDLTGYTAARISYDHDWLANFFSGNQDGYIQGSVDGGATWINLQEYHHNAPDMDAGERSFETVEIGGYSDVSIRFYYKSADDWWWMIDDIGVAGLVGEVIVGLGSVEGFATIANVPPTATGGFDNAFRTEAQSLLFKGFEVSDPAILEPTEWFAYAWDFDDGSAVDWVYVGSLAPPKLNILLVHTICLGPINGPCLFQGGGNGQFNEIIALLNGLDLVNKVDHWNFINYPQLPSAPSLDKMLQYDVIIVATNWAYFNYQPFNVARRLVGDRLAQYIDAGRGGAFSMMCVYCTSGGNDLFSIRGRYMDEDYGPFERANYLFPGATSIDILDPSHDIFVKVGPDVGSSFIHDGKLTTTKGGSNAAAGTDGVLLANWAGDGTTAAGAKTLNNGIHTVHFGGWHYPPGGSARMLVRNMIGYAYGNIPSPKIAPFTHTYGDNGIYTVDLTLIDDDMGYVWDLAANQPVAVLETSKAHRFLEVSVDNVDPLVVPGGIEAFLAAQVTLKVWGTAGNTVTLNVFTDGALSASVSVTRVAPPPDSDDDDDGVGGQPGDWDDDDDSSPTVKSGMVKVDVLAGHTYSATVSYSAPNGGTNPTKFVISPWRQPVQSGFGSKTYSYAFGSGALLDGSTVDQPLPTIKSDLLARGRGAVVDFAAEAFDPGTDDLAFFWVWGNVDAVPFRNGIDPGRIDAVNAIYTIHVFHNTGVGRTGGVLDAPHFLGYSEAYFDRALNTGRSSAGSMDMRVRDSAFHAFPLASGDGDDDDWDDGGGSSSREQLVFYVVLMVLDDDNTRGYPSTFINDGTDMEFILVDLRDAVPAGDGDDDDDDDGDD